MPIQQSDILHNRNILKSHSRLPGQRTAFLSHSHKDEHLALALQGFLFDHGVNLYIDWQDASMPEKPNAETADKIRKRIRQCNYFFYLATANSKTSRWCPWEIGFADGVKRNNEICVIPTTDGKENYGMEYMDLYRRIDRDSAGLGMYLPTHRYHAEPLYRAFT